MIKKIIDFFNPFSSFKYHKGNIETFFQVKNGEVSNGLQQLKEFNSHNIHQLKPYIKRWRNLCFSCFLLTIILCLFGINSENYRIFFIGLFFWSTTVCSFAVTILLVTVFKQHQSTNSDLDKT